jgi:hypothetical protein
LDRREVKVKLSLSMPTRQIRVLEVNLHSFLALTLDGAEWSTSRPRPLYPRKTTLVAIE